MKTIVTEDNTIHFEIPESEFLKLLEENEDYTEVYNKVADKLLKIAFAIVAERRKEKKE